MDSNGESKQNTYSGSNPNSKSQQRKHNAKKNNRINFTKSHGQNNVKHFNDGYSAKGKNANTNHNSDATNRI